MMLSRIFHYCKLLRPAPLPTNSSIRYESICTRMQEGTNARTRLRFTISLLSLLSLVAGARPDECALEITCE
jgi:hypothetical protein